MGKGYITMKDFSKEEIEEARKFCEKIHKECGLDKIDKRITASVSPEDCEKLLSDNKTLKDNFIDDDYYKEYDKSNKLFLYKNLKNNLGLFQALITSNELSQDEILENFIKICGDWLEK